MQSVEQFGGHDLMKRFAERENGTLRAADFIPM